MKLIAQSKASLRLLRLALLVLACGAGGGALAQKQVAKAAGPKPRLTFAINEGGAANADATETLFRFRELSELLEKTLRAQLIVVSVRDRDKLKNALSKHEYALLLARPNDVPAEAVRDFGYQLIATAKEPSQAWLVVPKDSTLKTIADVRGKTIVTPDRYSNMWRVANAMLRDANITMANENVKAMRDQAAIGWSMENGFFDVGVLNSVSGVARNWAKNGGRILAKSRELPNMPFIASPAISAAQVAQLRSAMIALESSDEGRVILKKIGLTGFQNTPTKALLDFLAWIGDLETAKGAGVAARAQ